jgi:hypothetical protein
MAGMITVYVVVNGIHGSVLSALPALDMDCIDGH